MLKRLAHGFRLSCNALELPLAADSEQRRSERRKDCGDEDEPSLVGAVVEQVADAREKGEHEQGIADDLKAMPKVIAALGVGGVV